MTEIEVAGPDEVEEPEPPYQNLFVPLVVVPALIVMVLVLVFLLFGAVAGGETTPKENLDRMLRGGANEREQAAFNLSRQAIEDWRAVHAGEEPRWGIDASFLPDVRTAWELSDPEDYDTRYVLAILLAQLGDETGGERLVEMLAVPAAEDPDATLRFFVLRSLGLLGDPATAPAVIEFLAHDDHGLQLIATAALQTLPGPATVAALQGMLTRGDLELRGQAAISLAELGDPSGADALVDLVDIESYALARQLDPQRWTRASDVSSARQRAVKALAALRRPEDLARLQALAADEDDPLVREAAMRGVRDWDDQERE